MRPAPEAREILHSEGLADLVWTHSLAANARVEVAGRTKRTADGNHPHAPSRVYNLGGDEPIARFDLAQLMIEMAGRGRHEFGPYPDAEQRIDIGSYYADNSLIEKDLGWRPSVSLREGLERTIQFFKRRRWVLLHDESPYLSASKIPRAKLDGLTTGGSAQ
jgi:nucleoside-diphosphate-sugar epimerase